jgi:hypothetical protein
VIYVSGAKRMLILDYCITLSLLHAVVVLKTSGIPLSWQWWIVWITTLLIQLIGSRFIISRYVMALSRSSQEPSPRARLSHIV